MSALTFLNNTAFIAQYLVSKGDQVVARLPGIAPGAMLQVPSNDTYQITASTVLAGNSYTSAPVTVNGSASLLARVQQRNPQGSYDFELVSSSSSAVDTLTFQKTTIGPVTFTILKDGVELQRVVVTDSFRVRTLAIGSTYDIYAVINGVTTDTWHTSNPNATITALTDDSDMEAGYFTLQVCG
jgi:hypothetical protein